MEVSYSEGVANRTGLESCVTMYREVRHEALTKVQAGQPLSRESGLSGTPSRSSQAKAIWIGAISQVPIRSRVVKEPGTSESSSNRNWEICGLAGAVKVFGPCREGR